MVMRIAQLAIVLIVVVVGASFMTGWAAANLVPASSAGLASHVPVPDDFKPAACGGIAIGTLVTGTGTFSGTADNDLILGSPADDTITGEAGDDCVLAGGGNDGLRAGAGDNSGGAADVLNGGPDTDTCAAEGGTPTYVSCEQTVAVHLLSKVTARQAHNDGTLTTVQTVTAANLAAAGFGNNDEALALWYHKVAAASTNMVEVDLKYDGVTTMAPAGPRYDLGASGRQRAFVFMARVDLGVLADFEVQLASTTAAVDAYLEKSELLLVRLSDFGTENVDWYWNKSTTNVANGTGFSGNNRAAVTWTPGDVEDWVYFASVHHAIDSTTVNAEARVRLDGATDSGDWSFEGENTAEEIPVSWWGYLSALSAAAHTLAMETRDDAGPSNNHRESAILVFRKDVWANVFNDQQGTVSVANGSDVQVATITNAVSAAQPLVVWGQGYLDLNTASTDAYLWVRRNGATIIDPQGDTASGLASGRAYDASDQVPLPLLGYRAGVAGALDLDLFASHTAGGSRNLLRTGLLVWGMAVWAP